MALVDNITTIMTKLSPTAQAVLNAVTEICPAPADEIAAAALRAAADQLLPVCSTQTDSEMQRMMIRNDFLVIAEELEGAQ